MLASELIALLQKNIAEHGDQVVTFREECEQFEVDKLMFCDRDGNSDTYYTRIGEPDWQDPRVVSGEYRETGRDERSGGYQMVFIARVVPLMTFELS